MNHTTKRLLAIAGVSALVLVGCSSEESGDTTATETGDAAASEVAATEATDEATSGPAGDGEPIVAAIETSYPPIGFVDPDSNENIGFLVDLLDAMEAEMGREIEFVESEFEQLIPSVRTGRIDVIAGGMTDTEERRELVDFVDYIATGPQPFTVADQADEISSLEDMCGREVGTPSFANYVAQLEAWSAENCPEGSPITVVGTEGAGATITQMEQGRRPIGVLGAEYVAHLVGEMQPDEFVKFGEPFSEDYFGLGFNQDATELRDAFAESLATLIEDGTYQDLLAEWNMQDLEIDQVRINGEPA